MTKIIGRKRELQQLEEAYKAEESLFVVVYGRRRVGKTFLVREAFDDKLAFYATGVNQETRMYSSCISTMRFVNILMHPLLCQRPG